MNQFQYSFYKIAHKKTENKFEPIFKNMKTQINVYKRQFELTLKTYTSEWSSELKEHEKNIRAVIY
jgi:hypothetical protein